MTTHVPYPALRDILLNEFNRLKLEGRETLTKSVAPALGIKESRLASWRAGQRAPDHKQCRVLAEFLRFGNIVEQNSLLERLTDSIKKREVVSPSDILEEIASGTRPLRFGSTSYSGGDGFLDLVFRRFLHIAGIDGEQVDRDNDAISLKDQLLQEGLKGVDVGLGLFATIDRALTIRFITTPIRVGINAVVLDDSLKRRSLTTLQLRDALTRENKETQQNILPIVMDGEVGGLYIRKMLRVKSPLVDFVDKFQESLYGERLIDREQGYAGDATARVPVVVVDEVTALYVLRYLEQRKQPQAAHLVFSLNNSESIKEEKKALPEFLVSISVNRKNRELVEYLLDAMRLFLRTEIETVSSYYVKLFRDLETLAKEFGPATSLSNMGVSSTRKRDAARRWTEYTFGLSNDYLDVDLPWSVILNRASSMLKPQERRATPLALRRSKRADVRRGTP